MSTIEEIKARINIVDLVSEAGVRLRHSGKNYTGFCPFHENKRTPAFVVFPETGTWRCFGQCNEGGDIFKFVMKKEGWDFAEALRHLAARAGVELKPYTPAQAAARQEHDRLRELLEEAVNFYRHHLLQTPAGAPVLAYLREKRGLTDRTIEAFGLGYAPPGWDTTLRHFGARYSQDELLQVGLLSEREADVPGAAPRRYDRFRHRIMIPIRDAEGRMAGFGARIVDPDDVPKFLNSPQTPLFDKGRLLYGLDRARRAIRAADRAVIVEGYLDVIALHQAGYENVVSPMGTALTEDQLRLLKKFTRRIVLALDPDAAGQQAVLRGLEAARQALDREAQLAFDARGLLRSEARLQADLRVASMPDNLDPDEIVARDREEWARLIENAQPVVTHVMNTLAAGQDLSDAKVRSRIAAQVLPLIEDLPDPIERETYRQQLARLLRVDERALIGAPAPAAGPPRRFRPRAGTQPPGPAAPAVATPLSAARGMELYCLGVLYHRPDLLYRLDRTLQEVGLPPLDAADFVYTDHQLLFRLIRQSLEQDACDARQYVEERLGPDLQPLCERLEAPAPEMAADLLREELARLVLKLRRLRVDEQVTQLHFLQSQAQEAGDVQQVKEYHRRTNEHTRLRLELDQAERRLGERRRG